MPDNSPTRSRYLAIKTSLEAVPDPGVLVRRILNEWPEAAVCWADHPAESGGHPHTHYMVRFPVQTSWAKVRTWLQDPVSGMDPHSYCAVGRSWTRAVRYLLHLDNPDKDYIPRESFHFEGEIKREEIEILLGAPRKPLLEDIRSAHCPKTPFGFVDWLVNERGHSPGEVASMLRCVLAASEYVARRAELEALQKAESVDEVVTAFGVGADIPEGMPHGDEGGNDCGPDSLFSSFGIPEGWG